MNRIRTISYCQRHHSNIKLQCFQTEVSPRPSTQDVQKALRQSQTSTVTVSIFFPQTVKCKGFPSRWQINNSVRGEAPWETWSHLNAWSLQNLLPAGDTFECSQMCCANNKRWCFRQCVKCLFSAFTFIPDGLIFSLTSSRRTWTRTSKAEKCFNWPVKCDATRQINFSFPSVQTGLTATCFPAGWYGGQHGPNTIQLPNGP